MFDTIGVFSKESSGCGRAMPAMFRSQHGAAFVNACIDDEKVIVLAIIRQSHSCSISTGYVLTFGNMCLSVRCIRRFCGAEQTLSQSSTKHRY